MNKYLLPILFSFFLWTSCGGDTNNANEPKGGPTDTPADDPSSRPDPDEEEVTNEMSGDGEEADEGEFIPKGAPHKDWGLGVILPNNGEVPSERVVWPEGLQLPVFDKPNGKKTGTLKPGEYSLDYQATGGEAAPVEHMYYVEYEADALVWYAMEEGWAAIRPDKSEKDRWINLADLDRKGYHPVYWLYFLQAHEHSFHVEPAAGLNLRTAPDAGADKLVTMKGDRFLIYLTDNYKGPWFEARVEERTAHPCEGDDELIKEYRGWFKALDDSGFPNIYFYTDC